MSLMMMLALSGKKPYVPTLRTKTFTSNATWPAPTGVSLLKTATGHGGRGGTTAGTRVARYTLRTYDQVQHADGSIANNTLGNYGPYDGEAPAGYCDPWSDYDAYGVRSHICYDYSDASTTTDGGTYTGTSSTGFGKVFPGSSGNTTPKDVSFTDVAITAGKSYAVTVPSGGSITITWME